MIHHSSENPCHPLGVNKRPVPNKRSHKTCKLDRVKDSNISQTADLNRRVYNIASCVQEMQMWHVNCNNIIILYCSENYPKTWSRLICNVFRRSLGFQEFQNIVWTFYLLIHKSMVCICCNHLISLSLEFQSTPLPLPLGAYPWMALGLNPRDGLSCLHNLCIKLFVSYRSGKYLYKPTMKKLCCPMYTIKYVNFLRLHNYYW